MSIQISVVIWTVICFAALYLILKYLLFEPVLAVMDKRQKKISDAENAEAENNKRLEERRSIRMSEQADAERRSREACEAEAERLRTEGKEKLEEAKKERNFFVESHRKKTEAEYEEELKKADSATERSAELFISRLHAEQ